MPAPYDEIRSALSRGFSVDNLRSISHLSLKALHAAPKHPAVFYALASVCRWIADSWDGVPISTKVADRVEGKLRLPLQYLLNNADEDFIHVCTAFDDLASAFSEAIQDGLDRDLA